MNFSVVVLMYNAENYIGKCVKSLQGENYGNNSFL